MNRFGSNNRDRLSLIEHYANREGMTYDEARLLIVEEAGSHDDAYDLLDELDVKASDVYLYDARQILDEAQS